MSSERFILLGQSGTAYFFLHEQNDNKDYKSEISHSLFDVMIDLKSVTINSQVIIYDITPTENNVTLIIHKNQKDNTRFTKEVFITMFNRFIKHDVSDKTFFVIKYNNGKYIPLIESCDMTSMSKITLDVINKVSGFTTNKLIIS